MLPPMRTIYGSRVTGTSCRANLAAPWMAPLTRNVASTADAINTPWQTEVVHQTLVLAQAAPGILLSSSQRPGEIAADRPDRRRGQKA
jgi:hypothetical protein